MHARRKAVEDRGQREEVVGGRAHLRAERVQRGYPPIPGQERRSIKAFCFELVEREDVLVRGHFTHEKRNFAKYWITTHLQKWELVGPLSPAQRKNALQLKQLHLNYKNSANQ